MIPLRVKEVAKITASRVNSIDQNALISGFSIDSRTIKKGEFFIAVKGENYDGHDYIPDALSKGAEGVIVLEEGEWSARHTIIVEDTIMAMGSIASLIRRKADIPVVCVTGTNGKTTVKDMLSSILSRRYRILVSKKSYNNIIGLSLTMFELGEKDEIAVLEVGTNAPGEIASLSEIARPNMAVITNIGEGHLEAFHDKESVFLEKTSLLDFVPPTGCIFLNKDDELLGRVSPQGVTKKFYGTKEGSDFRITEIEKEKCGFSFLVNGRKFTLPLEGVHNVYNAASAVAVSEYFGIEEDDIKEALQEVTLPGMRIEKVKAGEVLFINDSYNANPSSFESALEVLETTPSEGAKGVVAGDMLELGTRSEELHKRIGSEIASKRVDFLIALGSFAKSTLAGAIEAGMDSGRVHFASSHEEAAEITREMTDSGSVVLLKGSRKTRMEEVLRCFTSCYTH